ncbi:MAG: hypothetical protein NTZ38_01365, partial [Candidatus Taylorbacteria bacterium]|nr:hypothetical protein [Candidatus Taylorbacteria bacterium]
MGIWEEIRHYIYALFEACKLPTNGPADFRNKPLQDTPSRAIADLLASHLNHPVNVVAYSSRRACAKLLLQNNLEIQDAMHELLDVDESYQEAILMVLDAISLLSPDSIKSFSKEIQILCQSSNYAIRSIARIVGPRIGYEIADDGPKMIIPEIVSLPLIYQLDIPIRSAQVSLEWIKVSDGEPLPDSNNPVEIVRPFDFQIELIAKEAALPEINICYRAVEIMRQLMPFDLWSKKGEKDLKATLESARLHFTFHRPRPQLARRAIYHIIIELFNAHLLNMRKLCNLDPFLRFYDPFMVLSEPKSRPNCIMSLTGLSEYGGASEIWTGNVSEAVDSATFKASDGQIILAENTTLKHLSWETPSETRESFVCLPETPLASCYNEYHLSALPKLRAGNPLPL